MNCCFSDKKKQKDFHKIHPLPKKTLEQPQSILKNKRVKKDLSIHKKIKSL